MVRSSMVTAVSAIAILVSPGAAQTIRPVDLVGTWQVQETRDLKTGAIDSTSAHADVWWQFTASHFAVLNMERGRKAISFAEEDKLSPQDHMKSNYAKIWDDKGHQLFQARAGTYSIQGNTLRSKRVLALQPFTIGLEETYIVGRLDGNSLVLRTPVDSTGTSIEARFRRLN